MGLISFYLTFAFWTFKILTQQIFFLISFNYFSFVKSSGQPI